MKSELKKMIAKTYKNSLPGVDGILVEVEVDLAYGRLRGKEACG